MYRYMIEHPDWLPAEGKAELLPHYRLGEDRGRIYRVVLDGKAARKPVRLDRLDTAGLVTALDSPNGWQRDKAHQLLLERGERTAVPPLTAMAQESSNALARLHALCVLDGLGALEPEWVARALGDAHPGVRENALRLAANRGTPAVVAAAGKLVTDPDPKVRLQLAFTLGEWTPPPAGEFLGRLAVADLAEPFIRAAVLSSALPHCRALTEAVVTAGSPALDAFGEPLANLALALNERAALATLLTPLLQADGGRFTPQQVEGFASFLATLGRRQTTLAALAAGDDALAHRLRSVPGLVQWANIAAADETGPAAQRGSAARLLARIPDRRASLLALLPTWLEPRQSAELQRTAIGVLAATGDDSVPTVLLARLSSFAPATALVAFDALLAREPWTFALLENARKAPLSALDATRRSQLLKHSSPRVRTLAEQVLSPTATRGEVIAKFRPALNLVGDAGRGRTTFTRLCIGCHQLGELGHEVGPDLHAVANHPPEKLLANILDPSADVQPGFNAYQVQLVDGTELYGLIAAETGNSLTFKLADGTPRLVLRKDVAALRGSDLSLMPEGLENGLQPQDLADLIGFLKAGLK